MIVYVWNLPLKFEWLNSDSICYEMNNNWIKCLLPVFYTKKEAVKFCWEWNYLLLSQWK